MSDAEVLGKGALDLGLKYGKSQLPSLLGSMGVELPSLTGILGPGVGGAMAGAMAAMGPAAIAYAVAKILSAIAPPDDTAVTLGAGSSKALEEFLAGGGPMEDQARGLFNETRGDMKWAEGGDTSLIGDMDHGVGSMSMKSMKPFWANEGWAYDSPELAKGSGREIARARMGLPVTREAIPRDAAGIAAMLNSKSTPVVDGATDVDHRQWLAMLDARNSASGGTPGEGAETAGVDAYRASLDPRMQEFFDLGLTPNSSYAYTGQHMVPKDYTPIEEKIDETIAPKAPEGEDKMANMKKNSYLARELGATGEDEIAAVLEPWEAELLKMLGGKGTQTKKGALAFESSFDDLIPDMYSTGELTRDPGRSDDQRALDNAAAGGTGERDLEAWLDQNSTVWKEPESGGSTEIAGTAPYFQRGGNSGNLPREGSGPTRNNNTASAQPSTNTTGAQFDLMDQFLKATKGAPTTVKPPEPGSSTIPGYNGISWGNRPGARLDYIDTHGVVPFAKYNTGEDNTEFMFMPNDMNATTRKTLETINTLSDEDFNGLASFLGVDPNNEWADEWIYNYFGTHKDEPVAATYGPTGWTYTNPDSMPSALESGNYLFRGANISLDDIISGDVPSQAALEMAWAAGANQEDIASYAKSYGHQALGGRKLSVNDPEFMAARVRAENSTPIFNSYMSVQQAKQAARAAGGNPMTGGTGAVGSAPAPAISAGSQVSPAPEKMANGLYRYPDGTIVDWEGWQLDPMTFPNGQKGYYDTYYGIYRLDNQTIVDAQGRPVVTEYNRNIGPSSDPLKVYGSLPFKGFQGRDEAPNGEGGPQPWLRGTGTRVDGAGGVNAPTPGAGGGGGGSTVPGGGNSTTPGGATGGDDDPQAILDRILAAYPGDYATTRLGPQSDDEFISALLEQERNKAKGVVDRARASGQLNDVGANTAYADLFGPSTSVANSTLDELSGGILGGYRQDINDIIAELVDRASVEPNVSFDPYNQRIEDLVARVKQNYMGELIRKLGSNSLFDTSKLINSGGMAQSPVSGASFNPSMMF